MHRFGASSKTEAEHFNSVLCIPCEVCNGYASLLTAQHKLFWMTWFISWADHYHKGVQSILLSHPRQPKTLRGDFRDQEGLDLWFSLWMTGESLVVSSARRLLWISVQTQTFIWKYRSRKEFESVDWNQKKLNLSYWDKYKELLFSHMFLLFFFYFYFLTLEWLLKAKVLSNIQIEIWTFIEIVVWSFLVERKKPYSPDWKASLLWSSAETN